MRWSRVLLALTLLASFVQVAAAQEKGEDERKSDDGPKKVKTDKESPSISEKERRAIEAEVEGLAAQGPKGVAALAKKVREGNETWQGAALWALHNMGPDAEPAIESILPILKSDKLDLRILAIGVLEAIGPKAKSAIPALVEAAKETKDLNGEFIPGGASNVAEAALRATQAIDAAALPKLAEAMIPGLLKVVQKGDFGSTSSAVSLLGRLGPHAKPALPKLKELLAGKSTRLHRDALRIFMASGEEGMAILAEFMLDPKTSGDKKVAIMDGYYGDKGPTPSTIRILRALMSDESAAVRVAGVQALESARVKELIPKLTELLEDESILKVETDRKGLDPFHVARALGNQGKNAVPALMKALESKQPLARFQAARALAYIGKDAKDSAPALEKLFDETRPGIAIEAAKAVLKSGKPSDKARAILEKHLDADSAFVQFSLDAIRDLGPAGRPLLPAVKRVVLESSQYPTQRKGFEAVEQMQADPKEVVEIWVKLVKKNPRFIHNKPIEELRTHGKEVKELVPVVLELMKERDVNVRAHAIGVLTRIGPTAKAAIPALVKALDDDSFVAHEAMRALGSMGSDAKPAVAPLLQRFATVKPDKKGKDEKGGDGEYERKTILTALEGIGPGAAEAVPQLLELLPKHPQVARVLGKIGPDAKAGVPALEKLYRNERGYSKFWSAFALVKITRKTDPYVSELAGVFLKSKDGYLRRQAIEALAELGPDAKAALPAFILAVKETSARGRPFSDFHGEGARALVHLGPAAKEAVPYLIDMVKNSFYSDKIAAAEALGAIGPDAKDAIPSLEKMAAEDDRRLRAVAEKALANIRPKQQK
jgi:HEAT repeat protein